ncbi:tetratricopeptide repeat protein [Olivibacter sitiensis]|uniref:tetratricopeptide repeat protein n=1 Tax=Olivibacter sitiensis TaxID=376470 RepID=UPI000684ED50|nr:hypothetical protein [Olivibacter sitiensis]
MNRGKLGIEHHIVELKSFIFALVFGCFSMSLFAQNGSIENDPAARQGHIHFMDQKYEQAIKYFKQVKAPNASVNYMLGYSQFQLQDYKSSIASFTSAIESKQLTKNLASAYYYRAKAKNTLAQGDLKISDTEREKLLASSIEDYSSAIDLNNNETSYYLNRGIAYRDLGILRGTETTAGYDKELASSYYQKGIDDLQVVLSKNSKREDIAKEIKKVSIYKESLK